MKRFLALFGLGAALAASLPAQSSIKTAGSVETDAQLRSNVATGTPPLAVSSRTTVPNLSADLVDGFDGAGLNRRLINAETLLIAVQDQVNALGVARLPRTGQTTCYDEDGVVVACGTGIGLAQDGDLQLGVTWPNPRFTDNGDGTVRDDLTGLIWLADAGCAATVGGIVKTTTLTWADALTWANALEEGHCGLTDGSVAGKWRLPNLRELQSLVHYGFTSPALPNRVGTGHCDPGAPSECAFSGVGVSGSSTVYWTSSTTAASQDLAWIVVMSNGLINGVLKTGAPRQVWPVRGGQ